MCLGKRPELIEMLAFSLLVDDSRKSRDVITPI